MIKDAYYFPHDSNAFNDPKIIKMVMDLALESYAVYWIIIEKLRDESGYKLHTEDVSTIAFQCRYDEAKVKQILNKYKLFEFDDAGYFYSETLIRRMERLDEIRAKRREAGRKGGVASSKAKATLNDCSSSKAKQSKAKKSKAKQNKEEQIIKPHRFFEDKAFSDIFSDYLDMRKMKKKPPTEKAKSLILKKLEKYSVEIAIKMLEQSIVNSWTDVFELKTQNGGNHAEGKAQQIKKKKFDFEPIWIKHPKKLGKDEALGYFNTTVETDEDYANINKAVDNYNKYIKNNQTEAKYIQKGCNWFSEWKDWGNYKESINQDSTLTKNQQQNFQRLKEWNERTDDAEQTAIQQSDGCIDESIS